MSEVDSGVDSDNEPSDPVLLAHRPLRHRDADVNGEQDDGVLSPPIEAPAEQAMDHNESVFIQIDPPEFYGGGNNLESHWNAGQPRAQSNSAQRDTTSTIQANTLTDSISEHQPFVPTSSQAIAPEQPAAVEQSDPINTPSTSSLNVQVLGYNLRVDQGTINNLNSFYQSNLAQHDFCPKMIKQARKHRISHYEHLTAEKQLRSAANSNDYEAVVRALEKGVNVNAFDERKRTALHFASCNGNFAIAYALLDHGANPNQQDGNGNCPLHLAVCSSKLDIVILLLKNGANCNIGDNSGRTPLQLAKSKLALMSKNSKTLPTVNLKLESTKISIMLGIYFDKLNSGEKRAEIDVFKERLETRETNEEIEKDVNDLLKCLDEWSIN